jgi:hypothetical protein
VPYLPLNEIGKPAAPRASTQPGGRQ